jgi:transposase-like protein
VFRHQQASAHQRHRKLPGYAKIKLESSYYGVSRGYFYLYLKEMEFRFNGRM